MAKPQVTEHIINWNGSKGKKTLCGPFKINVAYVQGNLSQSTIPPNEHGLIINKLNKLGGLYIYKDGIRILPYGTSDYDFLKIEENRNKSFSYYYFSYRRMFGVIDICRKFNPKLIEKAGREGFIENKAYRQFKEIAGNFFVQLAADFFRDVDKGGGPKAEFWSNRKNELDRLFQASKEREKSTREQKNKLIMDLEKFFIQLENGDPIREVQSILGSIERDFEIISVMKDPDMSTKHFLNIESGARKDLGKIRSKYKLTLPKCIGLGKKLHNDWQAYLQEFETLETHVFLPAFEKIEKLADETTKEYHLDVTRRLRMERALIDISSNVKKITNTKSRETKELLNVVTSNVTKLTHEIMVEMDNEVKKVMSDFERLDVSKIEDSVLVSERIKLESKLISMAEINQKIIEVIQSQLENIQWTKDDSGNIVTSADITESMEEEILSLRERVDLDFELSQLGTAIAVIHHEFGATTNAIKANIRRLKAWADLNEGLSPIYNNIRNNFEHLDGYLTLFTPLSRRLYRKEIEIHGNTISQYIGDVFAERIKRHNILLEDTRAFDKSVIFGYPSTFFPVFINIVDNAIFWLKDQPIPRKILLDADKKGYFISNNGPRISVRDRENIFEQGFTRKPKGRGMGLYISREALSKVGYRIYVDDPRPGMEVTFRIESICKDIENC